MDRHIDEVTRQLQKLNQQISELIHQPSQNNLPCVDQLVQFRHHCEQTVCDVLRNEIEHFRSRCSGCEHLGEMRQLLEQVRQLHQDSMRGLVHNVGVREPQTQQSLIDSLQTLIRQMEIKCEQLLQTASRPPNHVASPLAATTLTVGQTTSTTSPQLEKRVTITTEVKKITEEYCVEKPTTSANYQYQTQHIHDTTATVPDGTSCSTACNFVPSVTACPVAGQDWQKMASTQQTRLEAMKSSMCEFSPQTPVKQPKLDQLKPSGAHQSSRVKLDEEDEEFQDAQSRTPLISPIPPKTEERICKDASTSPLHQQSPTLDERGTGTSPTPEQLHIDFAQQFEQPKTFVQNAEQQTDVPDAAEQVCNSLLQMLEQLRDRMYEAQHARRDRLKSLQQLLHPLLGLSGQAQQLIGLDVQSRQRFEHLQEQLEQFQKELLGAIRNQCAEQLCELKLIRMEENQDSTPAGIEKPETQGDNCVEYAFNVISEFEHCEKRLAQMHEWTHEVEQQLDDTSPSDGSMQQLVEQHQVSIEI